ncbi:TonB-dependent receptor [Myroides odoratimimus]|uniref:TonB-dependent receptor n=1 Tax=Myroides odoratimimus TaxID=76832 RepID=UPI0025763345|nr:TonB-dependent receptor [Myroides odoratimimus]MDM1397229.1 TonB-dependent receptor [Myroides odoratimimus]
MKLKYLFFLFAICFAIPIQGQNNSVKKGIVSGRVIDSGDKSSLPGAAVLLDNGKQYTVSNNNGYYEFLNIPEGKYVLSVSYIGYTSVEQEVEVSSGQNKVINLSLSTDVETLEGIVVIGERLKGQAKALNQQMNNANVTNVISADQVGRFPDSNIGDALKRVPGITMQNDQGEARNIVIRGLAPSLNSVTLNGDRIPSAEGDNRNVQMDLIPADMISSIEVNKTLTPDMDADAIGGSVDLITRASPYGERISATLAGGLNPIRDKGNYIGSFVYGNRFLDSKFGMILSGSYNSNNFGSDNVEGVWSEDKYDNIYMSEYDIRKYDVQRVRRSFSGAFDYKINDNHTIYASAMYNWRDDRENRYRVRYRGIKPEYDQDNSITGFTGDIRRETKGGLDNNRNKNTRLEDQRIQNYALSGTHLWSSNLDMDWSVNYSRASEDRPGERYIDFQNKKVAMQEDLTNGKYPLVTALGDQPDNFSLRKLSENDNFTKDSEFGAKLNFRVPFSVVENQKGRLRFGGRLRLKDKKRENMFYEFSPIGTNTIGNLATVPGSYYDGSGFQPGSKYVPGHFASNQYLGGLDLHNSNLFKKEAVPGEYLALNYKAKENIYAGYIRWDQDFNEKLSMILGARIEHTSIDYTGNHIVDESDLIGEVSNTNNYTNVLPSVTFKYQTDSDWIYRAAFTTALARPDYYALAPYINVVSQDNMVSAGNPDLKATYAYNFDLMAEKYFQSVGMFSAGVFYKNLKDFIYNYRSDSFTHENFNELFPGQVNPIQSEDTWKFMQQRNGDQVNLFGVEVAFQRQFDFIPGKFWKGLGVYVNYTYTYTEAKGIANEDGEIRKNMELPGASPHMFNGSLSWENDRFSARVSLNYSSDYLDALGGNSFEDSYYDKQLFLDANASYKITSYLRVFAEANNLTNQPLRYYQGVSHRVKQMEYYQPKFTLGLKFDF